MKGFVKGNVVVVWGVVFIIYFLLCILGTSRSEGNVVVVWGVVYIIYFLLCILGTSRSAEIFS